MEYIKFFENSNSREAYENGSDYTEPYVSYTPVIISEKYIVLFNGITIPNITVEKLENNICYVFLPEDGRKVTHSDVFYIRDHSTFIDSLLFSSELTENTRHVVYMDELDYYPEYLGNNTWDIYYDSEHSEFGSTFQKYNIVSEINTDVANVHYNKVTPEKILAKFVVVNDYAAKDAATLNRKVAEDGRLFDQIYINGTPLFGQLMPEEIPTKIGTITDYSVYCTFEEEGTYDIEYILKEEYVGTIPEGVFPPLQYFSEIIIPKGVTTIKAGAFSFISNYPYDTNSTINVIIPNTITLVEDNAVLCSYLNSSTIQKFISINPDSVSIGNCEK